MSDQMKNDAPEQEAPKFTLSLSTRMAIAGDYPGGLVAPEIVKADEERMAQLLDEVGVPRELYVPESAVREGQVTHLPDGSAFAIMSTPLSEDHWIFKLTDDGFTPLPEFGLLMGTENPARAEMARLITDAVRYGVKCATNNGRDKDFDPDAIVLQSVVGLLGYHTADGRAQEDDSDAYKPSPLAELFREGGPEPLSLVTASLRCAEQTGRRIAESYIADLKSGIQRGGVAEVTAIAPRRIVSSDGDIYRNEDGSITIDLGEETVLVNGEHLEKLRNALNNNGRVLAFDIPEDVTDPWVYLQDLIKSILERGEERPERALADALLKGGRASRSSMAEPANSITEVHRVGAGWQLVLFDGRQVTLLTEQYSGVPRVGQLVTFDAEGKINITSK
jgi:hypothetical protein